MPLTEYGGTMRRSSATLAAVAALAALLTALTAVAGSPVAQARTVRARTARAATTQPRPVRATTVLASGLSPDAWATARAVANVRRRAQIAARRPGEVTGLVRSFTGQPLAGACVTAAGPAGSGRARTAAGGRFFLSGLRAGHYALEFRACAQPGRYLPRWSGGAALPGLASPVRVTPGQVTRTAAATLPPASQAALLAGRIRPAAAPHLGGIAGRLTGPGGRRVTHTCAEVHFRSGWEGVPVSRRGTYSTGRNLPAGHYTVEFAAVDCEPNPGNWAPQWYRNQNRQAAATRVRVAAGRITRGIDGRLRHGGIISGSVTGPAGQRLSGICVVLFSPAGDDLAQISTRRGRYSFGGLPTARYRVLFVPGCYRPSRYLQQWWHDTGSFRRSRLIRVHRGGTVRGIDARLRVGGMITGTVRGASGRPLPGICVYSPAGPSAATRRDGHYQLEGLSPGRYGVEFTPGCNNNGNYLSANYPHRIRVADGQTIRGINAVLRTGGIISGRVTSPSGRPLAGMVVSAWDASGDGNAVCTGAKGGYAINQLPPGQYEVEFGAGCGARGNWAPQFYPDQPNPNDAGVVRVGRSERVTGIDATMRRGAIITGRVTSAAGRPVSKICVQVGPVGDAYLADEFGFPFAPQVQTGREGRYRVSRLPAGRYAVLYTACHGTGYADRWFGGRPGAPTGDTVDVGPGVTAAGISAVLAPGGAISGTVRTSRGKPVADDCEIATNRRTGLVRYGGMLTQGSGYRISGLPVGRYRVEFYDCAGGPGDQIQWFRRHGTPRAATAVRVTSGRTARRVDAALVRGGVIAGRVTARATGRPLRNMCVDAETRSGTYFGFGITGKDGRYRAGALNTGTYQLLISACGATTDLASVQLTRKIRVKAPRTVRGVNAALPAGGTISGRVTSPGRPALSTVCVESYPVRGDGPEGFTTTGSSGRYTLPGLQAGRYRVFFDTTADCDSSQDGLVPRWYPDAASRAGATIVTVRAGATTPGINATLQADGGISGTVTSASGGRPLTGICVRAIPLAAGRGASITVASGGRYSLVGLAPGQYRVRFSSGCGASGYATQWWKDAGSAARATVVTIRADTVSAGIDAALAR